MKRRNKCCSILTLLLLASASLRFVSVSAAQPPAIYDLGALAPEGGGNTPQSRGNAINASGQVAGYSDVPGGVHAFLYSGAPGAGGAMTDLGSLGTDSHANGLNDIGQVVGDSYVGATLNYHAFLYTSMGGMVDLGTLAGGTRSQASAINNSGQIVGAANLAGNPATAPSHAFLYSSVPGNGGHMTDLGTLGGMDSGAAAINASGQIVGGSHLAGNAAFHAILYTGIPGNGGHMTDLGTLGGTRSGAQAINSSGQIAGFSDLANGDRHAFLYSGVPGSGGHMSDLGSLGGTLSTANGINSTGQIAGFSLLADGSSHAFLYRGTPGIDGQMIDLDAWLKANNPNANWSLVIANGINDNGWITGWGIDNDPPNPFRLRAFLLDASSLSVPEPASFVLIGSGAAALWWCFRNRCTHAKKINSRCVK